MSEIMSDTFNFQQNQNDTKYSINSFPCLQVTAGSDRLDASFNERLRETMKNATQSVAGRKREAQELERADSQMSQRVSGTALALGQN